MQTPLFEDDGKPDIVTPRPRRKAAKVAVPPADPAHRALAAALPPTLKLGTSSWSYPGWSGLVWDGDYEPAHLSKHGLTAYAQHPLLRSVSVDRAFYKPLTLAQYAAYAAQVPDDFRFVIKAPSLVADALVREEGRGYAPNATFLDPRLAADEFAQPAAVGLGGKLGALVFQVSPLPAQWLARPGEVIERIGEMLRGLPDLREHAADAVVAVELRDPVFVSAPWSRMLTDMLRSHGATYCLGLHGKMPPIEAQLPLLRALWPGPLVCRWNLHRRHGAYGYEEAKRLYGNFDRLVDPDLDTRQALARTAAGTANAGFPAYVTIGNKAEGSAPRSVLALAEAIAALKKT